MAESKVPHNGLEVPLDPNGIVDPSHLYPFLDHDHSNGRLTHTECRFTYHHMYFPKQKYKFNDDERLKYLRKIPYFHVGIPVCQHDHYHKQHAEEVVDPGMDVVEACLREANLMSTLAAATLQLSDVRLRLDPEMGATKDDFEEFFRQQLFYEQIIPRIIEGVRNIECIDYRLVTGGIKRFADLTGDPQLDVLFHERLEQEPMYFVTGRPMPNELRKVDLKSSLDGSLLLSA